MPCPVISAGVGVSRSSAWPSVVLSACAKGGGVSICSVRGLAGWSVRTEKLDHLILPFHPFPTLLVLRLLQLVPVRCQGSFEVGASGGGESRGFLVIGAGGGGEQAGDIADLLAELGACEGRGGREWMMRGGVLGRGWCVGWRGCRV